MITVKASWCLVSFLHCDLIRDVKKREKLEKDVHDLKMSLDARVMELTNRSADVKTAENTLKDYEQQIRALHVSHPKSLLTCQGHLCRAFLHQSEP